MIDQDAVEPNHSQASASEASGSSKAGTGVQPIDQTWSYKLS